MSSNVILKYITRILFLLILGLASCESRDDRSTDTLSTSFTSSADKVAFMEKYYTPNFPYNDVEYHIIYNDNEYGRGTPGPSDLYMYFAFKLDAAAIKERMKLSEKSGTIDIDNWSSFLPKNKKWNIDHPKYRIGTSVIIEKNNILLLKIIMD